MPSSPPTLANDFQVTGSDNLDEVLWNTVFAEISALIKGLSATFQTLEELEQSTIDQSLAVIAQSVEPQVLALQQTVALAQAQVDNLILSGVAAGSVSVAEIEGLEATTVQAALAELLSNIGTGLAALATALAAETDARTEAVDALTFLALRPVITITAAHTALPGQRIMADCTGGAFDIKTIQDPVEGDTFTVYPKGLTVSVIPNDAGAATTIMGETSVTISQPNVAAEFEFMGGVWNVTRRSFPNG
jgi:hypothetical protein